MRRRQLLTAATAVALPGVARAQTTDVDLKLVLAIDVSRSIDEDEARLQRQGYIQALTDPRVIDAMTAGQHRRIALCYIEWAGDHFHKTTIDWTAIDGAAAAGRFAAAIAAAPPESERWTAVGAALRYSGEKLARSPFRAARQVIDISGDGKNNNGPPAERVRDELVARGIVINALPIVNDRPTFGRPPPADLDVWFEENVIGGPGAFSIVAKGFGDFARAVRTKMTREIS